MKYIIKHFFIFVSFLILFSSCVMQKQYDDLLTEKVRLEAATTLYQDSIAVLNKQLSEALLSSDQKNEEITDLKKKLASSEATLKTLKEKHNELNKYYDNLRSSSGKLNNDLDKQQQELLEIRENLEKTRQVNDALNADLLERERKVAELEKVLQNEAKAAEAIKKKIADALLSFDKSDLNVTTRNGKVYVSLAEKLLFKSGSITVDPKGVSALKQVASALQSQSQINIMVEGHTDNVPISGSSKYLQDNWDLSVLRATSIVKILTNNGVAKNQIIAAGKGEFAPIADNNSAENRQRNRRTEIIITPDLDELFKILNVK